MQHEYAEAAGLLALATNDGEAAIDIASRMAGHDGRAGDDPAQSIYSIPAHLDREKVEALGVVILDELPATLDEREASFVRAQIPAGWTVANSQGDHRLRYVLDERGVRRLSMSDNEQWWDRFASTGVVHQGQSIACRLCYGKESLDEVLWTLLTECERSQVVEALQSYVAEGAESPKIYGDIAAKAQHWLGVIAKNS